MMKQTNNLFGASAECPAFFPPRDVRNGAKASSNPPQRVSSNKSLRRATPELFAELVCRYGTLLDEAVDQRVHQGEPLSGELGDLSAQLGRLRAGARDIIELHAHALDDKLASMPPLQKGLYVEEGRLVLLELMGRLLSAYRTAFLQATQLSGTGG
jgi:hypothetical protein